jgi:hypothetical protein
VNIQISTISIDQYGLVIVDFTNYRFKQFVDLLKDMPALNSKIDPSTIFVENAGDREIIACRVEWTITDKNNNKFFSVKEFDNLDNLNKKGQNEVLPIKVEGGASKQYWLFNSGLLQEIVAKNSSGIGNVSASSYLASTVNNTTLEERTKQIERVKEKIIKKGILTNEQWEKQKNIVIANDYLTLDIHITIDGVLFVDGTYVGRDKTDFFEVLKKKYSGKGKLLKKIDLI